MRSSRLSLKSVFLLCFSGAVCCSERGYSGSGSDLGDRPHQVKLLDNIAPGDHVKSHMMHPENAGQVPLQVSPVGKKQSLREALQESRERAAKLQAQVDDGYFCTQIGVIMSLLVGFSVGVATMYVGQPIC